MQEAYYQSDRVTLYHGDCMTVMPHLSGFEAIITDVPYGEVSQHDTGSGMRRFDKGVADTAPVDIPTLVPELARLATSIYVFCGSEQVSPLRAAFVKSRMTTRQGVWFKSNPSPFLGQRLWLNGLELCVYARRVNATFNRFCESPIWRGPSERVAGFPCPKPVWLMRELLDASSEIDGLILDPYLGSGTTGVAAIQMGRRFVGIEQNEQFLKVAAQRIQEAEASTCEMGVN